MNNMLQLRAARLFLRLVGPFVPRRRYERALADRPDQDHKNEGFDLDGWTYHRVPMGSGNEEHRYYHRASVRPDAPALVFLHGLNLDGRNFLGYRHLDRHLELFAYDFPEWSERYSGSIDDMADLLDDFVDVLGLETVALAGVSFGGMVAIRWAGRAAPERPQALALISSRAPGTTEQNRREARMIREIVDSLADHQLLWLLDKMTSRHLRSIHDVGERARLAALLRPKDPRWYRQVMACVDGYDAGSDAARIACPTLAIMGTRDDLIPLEALDELTRLVPNCRAVTVEGAGHDLAFRFPERVTPPLLALLSDARLIPPDEALSSE